VNSSTGSIDSDEFRPAPGCLQVTDGEHSRALCSMASEVALARKSLLDQISGLAHDGLALPEVAATVLRSIKDLAETEEQWRLQQIDRDEATVRIVGVLDQCMTAEAAMHTENALAIVRSFAEEGWLVVRAGAPS
jgi:hypothetical protein